ncbi:MAG: MlaD family protein, partial [Thermodesulfobacteriota bacterium]
MEDEFSVKEKIAGLFMMAVVVILAITVMIVGRGKNWFKSSVTYYTTFNEGYNLEVDAPVKLFKADIGKVKEITPVENKVRVRLSILEDY